YLGGVANVPNLPGQRCDCVKRGGLLLIVVGRGRYFSTADDDQDHRRHPSASGGNLFGVPGASCRGLDGAAGGVFSQSAARFDRGVALRPRMATRLRQAAALALVVAGGDEQGIRSRSV